MMLRAYVKNGSKIWAGLGHQGTKQLSVKTNIKDIPALEKTIWNAVHNKKYNFVIDTLDALDYRPTSKPLILAEIASCGMLQRTGRVKKLFLSSEEFSRDNQAVYILLNSYCVSDRLDTVEFFLKNCLEKYITSNPEDIAGGTLYSQLFPPVNKGITVSKAVNTDFTDYGSVSFEALIQNDTIPLYVWATIIRMYSGRGAWAQCMHILEFIEKSTAYAGLRSMSIDVDLPSTDLPAHEPLKWKVDKSAKEHAPTVQQLEQHRVNNIDHINDSQRLLQGDSSTILQSLMYHHTLRALCAGKQFARVADLLSSMHKQGVQVEISSLVHMLSVFSCPSPSDTVHVTYRDFPQLAQLALSLKTEIVHAVMRMGDDIVAYIEATREIRQQQQQGKKSAVPAVNHTNSPGYTTAVDLVAAYVSVLSNVNETAVAEQFVQFLHHEYPFLLSTQAVSPLIAQYKRIGQAEKAKETFRLLLTTLLANSSPETAETIKRLAQQTSSMAYHDVASALRAERKIGAMAEFVHENGRDMKSTETDERDARDIKMIKEMFGDLLM